MSRGAPAGNIPGLGIACYRVRESRCTVFVADVDEYFAPMQLAEGEELKPTQFFVAREER
jgi:hypothetical protein